MDSKKRKKLEEMGGRVTTVSEFLGLDAADELIVELRLQLAAAVRTRRIAKGLTQADLAKALGSSQSRVAKMEGGDPQASLESLVSAVVAVGGRPQLKLERSRRTQKSVASRSAVSVGGGSQRRQAAATKRSA